MADVDVQPSNPSLTRVIRREFLSDIALVAFQFAPVLHVGYLKVALGYRATLTVMSLAENSSAR